MKTTILVVAVTCVATGCALFTPPNENPVTQDYAGSIFSSRKVNVFSLTPERRTVLVLKNVEGSVSASKVLVCAEPPPDAAQNIASSMRAFAEASAKDKSGNAAGASAEFSKALNTSMTSLFFRSQGIQLFRDGLFSLCQANLNGLLDSTGEDNKSKKDPTKFWVIYNELLNVSKTLIAQEIPSVQKQQEITLVQEIAKTKTSVDAALQAVKEAQAETEKGVKEIREMLKKTKKTEADSSSTE